MVNIGKQWPSDNRNHIFISLSGKNFSENYKRIFGKKKVYLAGAIEYAPNEGQAWREELTPILEKLGYEVINPYMVERVYEGKEVTKDNLDLYRRWVREKVIVPDLEKIDGCSFVVVHWDKHAHSSGGTNGELMYSAVSGVPVYLIEGEPREKISGWILGCTTEVFKTFLELEEFLSGKE
jgi:nucleoside 2-deoxyribosyltransferase